MERPLKRQKCESNKDESKSVLDREQKVLSLDEKKVYDEYLRTQNIIQDLFINKVLPPKTLKELLENDFLNTDQLNAFLTKPP